VPVGILPQDPEAPEALFDEGCRRWHDDLAKMIDALDLLAHEHDREELLTPDEEARIAAGLELLARRWRNLWW
jgi:hypothetical protein